MTDLWYRFNVFAERQFFENEDVIDGIVVPAHLIAYYEVSFSQFLKETRLPFLIDPVTYVWDIPLDCITNDNGELKKSYSKFVEKLDCSVGNILGKTYLHQSEFSSEEFNNFIDKVIRFELLDFSSKKPQRLNSIQLLRQRIKLVEGESTVAEEEHKKSEPYGLIPPYFFFRKVTDDAYSKTLYAAEYTKAHYGKGRKVFPCLCMSRSLLQDKHQLSQILTDFRDFEGIIYWISSFEESTASIEELETLTEFVSKLSSQGKEVMNLYGGFFSLALQHVGLSKMSCGICYSSSRNVHSEVTGGGLPVRYYEPSLKLKIMRDAAFKLYSDMPELFACKCPICSEYSDRCQHSMYRSIKTQILSQFFIDTSSNGNYLIDWETSRLHFLYQRKIEQRIIGESSIEETINDLSVKYKGLRRKQFDPQQYGFGFDSISYLSNWGNALMAASQ